MPFGPLLAATPPPDSPLLSSAYSWVVFIKGCSVQLGLPFLFRNRVGRELTIRFLHPDSLQHLSFRIDLCLGEVNNSWFERIWASVDVVDTLCTSQKQCRPLDNTGTEHASSAVSWPSHLSTYKWSWVEVRFVCSFIRWKFTRTIQHYI